MTYSYDYDDLPDNVIEEEEKKRPGLVTTLLLLILILAMLTTLIWPLLRRPSTQPAVPPTPTPFLQHI